MRLLVAQSLSHTVQNLFIYSARYTASSLTMGTSCLEVFLYTFFADSRVKQDMGRLAWFREEFKFSKCDTFQWRVSNVVSEKQPRQSLPRSHLASLLLLLS